VLLGDLTGKVLVRGWSRGSTSSWECTLMGQHVDIETEEQLGKVKKTIESAGYYWTQPVPRRILRPPASDPTKIDALFQELVLKRVQEWLDLADERLAGKPFQMFMSPGNDDWPVIDEMIDAASWSTFVGKGKLAFNAMNVVCPKSPLKL